MYKEALKELEDAVYELECEARRHSQRAMMKGDSEVYMYWRGKRFAFSDVRIKISELINE